MHELNKHTERESDEVLCHREILLIVPLVRRVRVLQP